jgi:hypothetical protein
MKNYFKNIIILLTATACSLLVLYHSKKLAHPYIYMHKTGEVKIAETYTFPGYNIDNGIVSMTDGIKFTYKTGVTNTDGTEKKGFFFISMIPGYYYSTKIITGANEENKIIGIKLIKQAGVLSMSSENTEGIKNTFSADLLEGRDFYNGKNSETLITDQIKGIDFSRKINIINSGYAIKVPVNDINIRNTIYAGAGNITLVNAITECLKQDLNMLKKILSAREQNTGGV